MECKHDQLKDLTQGLGESRHWFCPECKGHRYRGVWWTAKEWEMWVNTDTRSD